MSATNELRRMLDERGVKYDTHGERYGTWYDTPLGGHVYVSENNAGYLHVRSDAMTPEQAIDATLGRGTCHDVAGKQMSFFACSACGGTDKRKKPRFCHGCGRVVVDDVLRTE